jgi:low molecular weight protein-tyrosine phosphatase
MARDVRILFVCMGNICRSPSAEAVFRDLVRRAAPHAGIEVDSAGTHDYHVGQPPDARSIAAARRRGVEMSALRARLLLPEDFERFDLLLVMDERNRLDALARAPNAAAVGATQRLRLMLDYAPDLAIREVPDPYYGAPADFERVLDLLEAAARGLLAALTAPSSSVPSSAGR